MKFASAFVFAAALVQFAAAYPYYSDCGCNQAVQTAVVTPVVHQQLVAQPQVFVEHVQPSCHKQVVVQPQPQPIIIERAQQCCPKPQPQPIVVEQQVQPVQVQVEPVVQVVPSPDVHVHDKANYNPTSHSTSYTVFNLAVPQPQTVVETVVVEPEPVCETVVVERQPQPVFIQQAAPCCCETQYVYQPAPVVQQPVCHQVQEVVYQQVAYQPAPVVQKEVVYQQVAAPVVYQPAPVVQQVATPVVQVAAPVAVQAAPVVQQVAAPRCGCH
ncbi:uncharacterized protein LOC113383215 [Ctenocephalides felis]|uniref:uncharacterized protein LOC113383215 n=1 Tax=Ctenocephalides felis TaxID=7515 RepID=UPI000E6E4AF8|nr:uncharacterized protein LOC113383215 [Ctenocephalides felis]